MTNYEIADCFSLLAKLMDIHGENAFKVKSYSSAAFNIENLTFQLDNFPQEKISSIKGIGDAIAQKIMELLSTGKLALLEKYLQNTPAGILEMMHIKGLGPKKIATIWKDLEIESIGELLYACNENRLLLYKGFGAKTQQNIKDAIEFYLENIGTYLYQQIEPFANELLHQLQHNNPAYLFGHTGSFKMQGETIDCLEFVTTMPTPTLITLLSSGGFEIISEKPNYVLSKANAGLKVGFYITDQQHFPTIQFVTSCSEDFLQAFVQQTGWNKTEPIESETVLFKKFGKEYIPPFLRETPQYLIEHSVPTVIEPSDIKGIIHSHSNWSDGMHTIAEMAEAAIKDGYEYLVLSDHSKTAFYAQGLTVEKVIAQHRAIDEWNNQYVASGRFDTYPFKIFKSIESDILNDGQLDYDTDILNKFDIIIASVHSNLKMPEEKAMARLLTAISNPFTSILGHMTGRLLLSRAGYPVNHTQIIDACATHNVVIELNAHPRRLDIDWRYIQAATKKGVLISINPDAHSVDGFNDCRYGVLAAQKGGLTKHQNLSSFSLKEIEKFIEIQKNKRLQ